MAFSFFFVSHPSLKESRDECKKNIKKLFFISKQNITPSVFCCARSCMALSLKGTYPPCPFTMRHQSFYSVTKWIFCKTIFFSGHVPRYTVIERAFVFQVNLFTFFFFFAVHKLCLATPSFVIQRDIRYSSKRCVRETHSIFWCFRKSVNDLSRPVGDLSISTPPGAPSFQVFFVWCMIIFSHDKEEEMFLFPLRPLLFALLLFFWTSLAFFSKIPFFVNTNEVCPSPFATQSKERTLA